ncbi:hypothetical protein ACLOJK_015952 [Asimina triloba]
MKTLFRPRFHRRRTRSLVRPLGIAKIACRVKSSSAPASTALREPLPDGKPITAAADGEILSPAKPRLATHHGCRSARGRLIPAALFLPQIRPRQGRSVPLLTGFVIPTNQLLSPIFSSAGEPPLWAAKTHLAAEADEPIAAIVPSYLFERLDVACKITSIALAARVSKLEDDAARCLHNGIKSFTDLLRQQNPPPPNEEIIFSSVHSSGEPLPDRKTHQRHTVDLSSPFGSSSRAAPCSSAA